MNNNGNNFNSITATGGAKQSLCKTERLTTRISKYVIVVLIKNPKTKGQLCLLDASL